MTNTAPRETEEAVLDSIRRLLADGQPPRRRTDDPVPGTEKLLLTPALRIAEGAAAAPSVVPPPSASAAWSLEERIAELEAAVGDRTFEWEPDGSEGADAERPSRPVFRNRAPEGGAEPRGMAEAPAPLRLERPDLVDENDLAPRGPATTRAEPRPALDSEPEDGFDIFGDDRLPDPDALRDLVAEIVRAELQSDLGQRVTRNIRKLVRREIRRALTARDFD